MKKFIVLALLGLALFGAKQAQAYTVREFLEDSITDTKELYQGHLELRGAYFYDFLAEGAARNKVGASIPMLAWKFITIDPMLVYQPSDGGRTGEAGLSFSFRPGRIPLGGGVKLEDLTPKTTTPTYLDRVFVGLYTSQNFTTGRFGFGFSTGIKF